MNSRDLAAALERDYAIGAASIERHPGGFEADAFLVDGQWFVIEQWGFRRLDRVDDVLDQVAKS